MHGLGILINLISSCQRMVCDIGYNARLIKPMQMQSAVVSLTSEIIR
jgi:hypothetical protein